MIFRRLILRASVGFLITFLVLSDLHAGSLTSKDFQRLGAGELIGTLLRVQLATSTKYYEEGTVEITVDRVIAGDYSSPTLSLPFHRNIRLGEHLANWDNIGERGKSFKDQSGIRLLIYFSPVDGGVALSQADNAVQNISTGLILGWVRRTPSDGSAHAGSKPINFITVDVNETVFGFVDGSTAKLGLDSDEFPIIQTSNDPEIGNITLSSIVSYCRDRKREHQVLIYFVDGNVETLTLADPAVLATIEEMDKLVIER